MPSKNWIIKNPHYQDGSKNPMFGKRPWNYGLTKDTDVRVKRLADIKSEKFKSGEIIKVWLGKKHSIEHRMKNSLAKKGPSKVTSLASELGMARTSVYRFLDLLQKKGLVSQIIEDNVKTYSATEPTRFLEIIKETENEVEKFVQNIENMKKESKEEVSVKVFKGYEGVKSVMADIIREGKDYMMIGEGENFMEEELFTFSHHWVMEVEKKKIKGKLLGTKEMFRNAPISSTEKKRYIAKELVPKVYLVIYGNKTIQIIWSKIPYSIMIENEEITESNKVYFNYLWEKFKIK